VIDWTPADNSRVLDRIEPVFTPKETRLDFIRAAIAPELKCPNNKSRSTASLNVNHNPAVVSPENEPQGRWRAITR
jgi:hypothetical protein